MTELEESTAFDTAETSMTSQHIAIIEIVDPKTEYPVGLVADLTINVSCPEGCDLGGGTILIGDENDQVLAEQILTHFDEGDGLNTTGSFSVQIPKEAGTHCFTIVFYPAESDSADADASISVESPEPGDAVLPSPEPGDAVFSSPEKNEAALHAIVQIEYSFEAVGHVTGMAAWRSNSNPVPVGNEFVLNVGIKCIHGCKTPGQKIGIYLDNEQLATVDLLEPEPPLTGLYKNQVTLTAPAEVGTYVLECRVEPDGLDLLHASNTHPYSLSTTPQPQCQLEITTLRKNDGAPVEHAYIVIIPKDGFSGQVRTNAEGRATIGVARGEQQIRVVCDDYLSVIEDIMIPEGQEVFELTFEMLHTPGRLE